MQSESQRSIETHRISNRTLRDFPSVVKNLLFVKAAAAQANAELGCLTGIKAQAILDACSQLAHSPEQSYPIDVMQGGGGVAINMAINEMIAAEAANANACVLELSEVNCSQSTADVCATAIRLSLYDALSQLREILNRVEQTYLSHAAHYQGVSTLARTCLRDAGSITYGQKFIALASLFNRLAKQSHQVAQGLVQIRLGSTALGTFAKSSKAFHQKVVAQLAQCTHCPLSTCDDPIDRAQHIDDLADVVGLLDKISNMFIKHCQDLRLLFSGPEGGLAEINIPPLIQGSSFYPNKSNPTLIETLLQVCFRVQGHCLSARLCLQQAELDLNVFEWFMGIECLEALTLLTKAIDVTHHYSLQHLEVNVMRCERLSAFAIG